MWIQVRFIYSSMHDRAYVMKTRPPYSIRIALLVISTDYRLHPFQEIQKFDLLDTLTRCSHDCWTRQRNPPTAALPEEEIKTRIILSQAITKHLPRFQNWIWKFATLDGQLIDVLTEQSCDKYMKKKMISKESPFYSFHKQIGEPSLLSIHYLPVKGVSLWRWPWQTPGSLW